MKIGILFILPLLVIILPFVLLLADFLLLILLFIRDLILPIFYFVLMAHFLKNSIENGKIKKAIPISMLSLILFAVSVIINFPKLNVKLPFMDPISRLVWTAFCGLVIIGHTVVNDNFKNSSLFKGIVITEAAVSLCVNAFLTYLISPVLSDKYPTVDTIEIPLLTIGVIVLCIYSFILGKTITKRHIVIKSALWFIGISASTFVTLTLLSTPPIPPTISFNVTLIWLVSSFVIFSFYLFANRFKTFDFKFKKNSIE